MKLPRYSLLPVLALLFLCVGNLTQARADVVLSVVQPEAPLVEYSMEDLEALMSIDVTTNNDFIDGEAVFSGPLVRNVLSELEADETLSVIFYAANDYFVEIPVEEFDKYDVIMAVKMDGAYLSRRDKGPIWIIYPMSDHEELQDAQFNNRLIWQVVKMELK